MIEDKKYPELYNELPKLKENMNLFVDMENISNKEVKKLAEKARENIYVSKQK